MLELQSADQKPSERGLPLCANQEHLLLSREYFRACGSELAPTTVPSVLRIQGQLDYSAVEHALNDLIRRHTALRTTFFQAEIVDPQERAAELHAFARSGVFRPGLYRQLPIDHACVNLCTTDLSSLSSSEKGVEIGRAIKREASCEFDYGAPPLLRATLLRIEEQEHLLILIVDHLVSDAWSMRIIRREFVQLYSLYRDSKGNPLQTPPMSYVDYAVRQDQMIRSGDFDRALEYWRKQWSIFGLGRVGFDDLPFTLPRPEAPSFLFGSASSTFGHETSAAVRSFVRQARITPYVFFLAAYSEVLRRYSEKKILAIWGHFANRMHPEGRTAVGWFANTHILGFILHPGQSRRDLLIQARRAVLDASEHQELPVALVWRAMGFYPRDPDAKVLLDVTVIDELAGEPKASVEGFRIRYARELSPSFGRLSNLGLYIVDDTKQFSLSIQYSMDRFPASIGCRLLEDFRAVVDEFLANPDAKVFS